MLLFFIIIINVVVQISLRVPRLILQVLKLTTIQTFSGYYISNYAAWTWDNKQSKRLLLPWLLTWQLSWINQPPDSAIVATIKFLLKLSKETWSRKKKGSNFKKFPAFRVISSGSLTYYFYVNIIVRLLCKNHETLIASIKLI